MKWAAPVPARPAATVMLVRDAAEGMEVLLLRRSLRAAFVAGAYVFPGGALDDSDQRPQVEALCDGWDDATASIVLGVGQGGLAYWVAAIRECFEEAGLLLARSPGGDLLRFDDPQVEARFARHRAGVDRGERDLHDVCVEEGLTLAADAMHYFGHWITPAGSLRRYDTRFFVARAPEAQVPLHDDREAIAHVWARPADALAQNHAGSIELILPTIRNLAAIARFDCTDNLLAAVAATTERVPDEGGTRVLLPGESQ